MQIAGKATKPLRRPSSASKAERRSPPNSATTATRLPLEFVVEKSGSYWFELTDREGLRGGSDDRWEIHAVPDAPPTVSIEQPTANLFVTPRAVVPIRVSAKDDLAIARHRVGVSPRRVGAGELARRCSTGAGTCRRLADERGDRKATAAWSITAGTSARWS